MLRLIYAFLVPCVVRANALRGQQTLGVHEEPVVPANPALIAQNATLSKLEARLDDVTDNVQEEQLKLDTLSHNLATIEGVTGQSRINLANSMGILAKISDAAAVNKDKAEKLDKDSQEISEKVKKETDEFEGLAKRLTGLEESSKLLNSDAAAVGKKVSALEKLVSEAMPGGDVSERLATLQKKIESFDAELKKGIDKQAKKDLETLINNVRDRVGSLEGKMEKGEWMPTPLENLANEKKNPSVLEKEEGEAAALEKKDSEGDDAKKKRGVKENTPNHEEKKEYADAHVNAFSCALLDSERR